MQLTHFTNYAMRTLMYCALRRGALCRVRDIANAYGVSEHHLMKVVQVLGHIGAIESVRGRGGGIRLAREPHEIVVGDVVRATEGKLHLVECFHEATSTCPLAPACRFRQALHRALEAFFLVLDGYTVADLVVTPGPLVELLRLEAPEPTVASA
ncbi:MAG: Rrf2 family transcriptional regulator [Alphaproteobacteria bacterium]